MTFGPVGSVRAARRSAWAAHARQTPCSARGFAAHKIALARAGRERRNPGRPSCGITPPYRNGDTAPANSVRQRAVPKCSGAKKRRAEPPWPSHERGHNFTACIQRRSEFLSPSVDLGLFARDDRLKREELPLSLAR
jgi:hypothetical protein